MPTSPARRCAHFQGVGVCPTPAGLSSPTGLTVAAVFSLMTQRTARTPSPANPSSCCGVITYRQTVRPDPPLPCSDEELLTSFCGGQRDAFGALVRRYERELYGYLCRYLGDRHLADDVFQ